MMETIMLVMGKNPTTLIDLGVTKTAHLSRKDTDVLLLETLAMLFVAMDIIP